MLTGQILCILVVSLGLNPVHLFVIVVGAAPRGRPLSSLSVMKTVTATNPGQLAVFISSLRVSGYECGGYGFKIMNCKSFILKSNASRKIEITYVKLTLVCFTCCLCLFVFNSSSQNRRIQFF